MPIEKFHGPNVQAKDVESVKNYLRRREAQVFETMKKKEVGRTEWHDRMITCTQEILLKECTRLGLSHIVGVAPEKYLFLSAEDFAAAIPDGDYQTRAFYSTEFGHVVLNAEESRERLFSRSLHEGIHTVSYHDVMISPEGATVAERRLGVEMVPPTQSARFKGLNESVTERLRWKLANVYRAKIQSALGFTEAEMHDMQTMRSYTKFIDLLDVVNERIAEDVGTARDNCWDVWTKAMLTGELMGIRQVERSWGDGSLRILSRLGYDKPTDVKVFRYFNAKSESMRERIRRELLEV